NHLYKMVYSSPDSVARIFTQMRYFAPKAISSGISRDDILDLGAWLDRMGLGQGRGGSGLNMLIKNLQAPAGKVKMSNLEALGVYGSDGSSRFVNARTGAVDLMGLMTYIAAQSQTWKTAGRGAEFNRHIARGFDTNAANVLQTLATMGGMEQLRRIKAQQAKMPSLEAAQAQLMGTLNNQTKLLISNFHSLATEIGFTLLPQLTAFVGGLAAATGNMAMWMHNHPHAAKLTGYGLLGLGAAGAWAGLKLGGEYIAHAAPWMLRRGPMRLAAGILGFGLEHGQKSFVGRMTGSLLGGGFRAVATQQGLREMVGVGLGAGKKGLLRAALMDIGTVFQLVGRRALITRVGLGLVGEILLKLGLRAIPVVGQILTVIDILTFLGRHSLDIGKIIGEGAHLLVNGLTYAWDGIKTFFGNLVHFILGGPGVWMHGAGGFFSSIGSAFSNFGKGVSQGWRALDAHPGKSKVAHAASGGFTRGDGLAYLHKSEFVVNPPLTRKLEALTRNVARNESSRPVIIKFGDINVNGDQKSAKQIAKEIAGEVAALFAKSGRLDGAGAVISGFGFLPYELAGGMS
ncbi:MAG TPA: phage tail tape measure protein, partial [Candidatus Baltobacteraceae bacterium]|nr:phage tail tape measure protein [Candidatus Baltobacteraceae bacterium]